MVLILYLQPHGTPLSGKNEAIKTHTHTHTHTQDISLSVKTSV